MKSLPILLLSIVCSTLSYGSNTLALSETEIIARMDSIEIQSMEQETVPFSELLSLIKEQLGNNLPAHFIQLNRSDYDPEVRVKIKNASLAELLTQICQQVNYTWRIQNGAIVFQLSSAMTNQESDSKTSMHIYSLKIARTHCFGAPHHHIPSFTEELSDDETPKK